MKEKLIDIVQTIDSYAKVRKKAGISSVARVHCLYNGEEKTFWFTNNYVNMYGLEELRGFGNFVPKNSNVAIKMQTVEVGSTFEYSCLNYIKRMTTNHVTLENRSDFQNQTIAIAGDSIIYQYRNINEFLKALKQNQDDINEVESEIFKLRKRIEELKGQKDTSIQRGQITRSINELLKEYRILTQQQEDLKNITIYIRKQGEMRYSLIVDTIQTRIKSQNLYDGITVIIDGGPGTGKSTTMIHRLAYLTDIFAINEDEEKRVFNYKLNTIQRNQLREAITANRDWMFFSPSQMLKKYLAEAMRKEGLANASQKVWNWKDYCRLILQENYRLLGTNTIKAPFRVCYLTETLFYQDSDIINEFTNFYLQQLREIKGQLPKLNAEGNVYVWTAIAKSIAKRFEDSENYDIGRFISLFISLESVYGDECKNLLRENNLALKELADEICILLDKNKDVKSDIESLLDLTGDENDDRQEEDVTVEYEQTDKLSIEIRKWLKSYCYSKVCEEKQLSDLQELISETLIPILGTEYESQIRKIGELIEFEQFAKYTRGVQTIMLNGLASKYKKFRTYLIKMRTNGCNLKLLRDIIQRKQGKELHHQEQSLLVGFINTLVKQIKATTNSKIKHDFIDAYEEVSRPIIGIDEATDFSAYDIYAMQSLLTRDFYSLTLCGDMMQRMTDYGIKSWNELNGVVPNPMVVKMKTSYRQSKKLLEVARQLYQDTLNETPNYKAFMKSNKVPAPLMFISENEFSKIEWISKRISEVYRAYGEQLPSIAIFVNDKGYIPRFAEKLQNEEFFVKNNIKVIDGTIENDNSIDNHINVYPIDVVKGMEFDVVFFHNLDNSSVDFENLKRYIYVGVSRAAFFLGITLSEQNHEIGKYFVKNKDWFNI